MTQPTNDSPPDAAAEPRSVVVELRKLAEQQARELTHFARDCGEQALADGKSRAAAQLSAVGGAVRRAADKLHDQDSLALAEYVDGAAERVEDLAHQIEERDLGDLAREAENLARQKPLLFLGGMFVAGLATAALLKAMNLGANPSVSQAPTSQPPRPPVPSDHLLT